MGGEMHRGGCTEGGIAQMWEMHRVEGMHRGGDVQRREGWTEREEIYRGEGIHRGGTQRGGECKRWGHIEGGEIGKREREMGREKN